MKINIITIFPDVIDTCLKYSLLGKAASNGLVEFCTVNPRDFSANKHRQVDDYPYGGGPGMLLMAPPIVEAVESIPGYKSSNTSIILPSPCGKRFDHEMAQELGSKDELIFISGHYEGIDERVCQILNPIKVSLGDFVTMGGEFPCICMIEAVTRLIPGVIGDSSSYENDSFFSGMLDHPSYTRPAQYRGLDVPEILLSGHHQKIKDWQRQISLKMTRELRPDLFDKITLDKRDLKLLQEDEID